MVATAAQSDTDTDLERVNAQLAEVSRDLADTLAGGRLRLIVVPLADLHPARKNARFQTNATFKRLVENLRRDGGLSSVPLIAPRPAGGFDILSGNHRYKAAKEAGIPRLLCLCYDAPLSRDEQVAIQLSHNAIEGQDDLAVLKELWAEIDTLELKSYSGLDDKVIGLLGSGDLAALSEAQLQDRVVKFLFLPKEVSRLEASVAIAREASASCETYLVELAAFSRLMDALALTEDAHNVRNAATALCLILDLFERNRTQLADGWFADDSLDARRAWVPLASIFGEDRVPPAAARVVKRAVDRLIAAGDVPPASPWMALEYLAAETLGGPDPESSAW